MPRQSNGNYIQPANTAAVSGQAISSTSNNSLITDIGTEITNSVDRGGRSAMQAALPMGGQKITGMADPTVSTDGATKNYVDTTTQTFFSTGDVKLTIKTAADTGWVMFDDGTIGSATSGSTSRANADTQALFTLIFNNISDTYAPIFTSGGGATTRAAQTNAASAWAANCRISLTKTLGRALGISGSGSGLTARTLGQTLGEESHPLTAAENGPHQHNVYLKDPGHTHIHNANISNSGSSGNAGGGLPTFGAATINANTTGITIGSVAGTANDSLTASAGSGTPHNNMQPTSFLNAMIKL